MQPPLAPVEIGTKTRFVTPFVGHNCSTNGINDFKSRQGILKGGSITVPLTSLFDWFGISCMSTDNYCFYLQNSLIQTSQMGD
jgi:hypothetical protein